MHRRNFLHHVLLIPLTAPAMASARNQTPDRTAAPLIAPPDDFVGLARWRRAARRPLVDVTANDSATVRFLARAIAENQSVCFRYAGGELHRLKREVTPGALFRVDDFPGTYVSGYCHLQQAERTFSVERISDLRPAALDPIIYSAPTDDLQSDDTPSAFANEATTSATPHEIVAP